MRMLFGALALLIVLAIVAMLAKTQLSSTVSVRPLPADVPALAAPAPAGPLQQPQQFKQAVEGLMQQPRPMPDDKP